MTVEAKQARGMPVGQRICQGRVMVIGSADMFGDEWLDREHNSILMRCVQLLLWLFMEENICTCKANTSILHCSA